MTTRPDNLVASTTEASAALAQSRDPTPGRTAWVAGDPQAGRGVDYEVSVLAGGAAGQPYERRGDDPIYRPLRIFTSDPSASSLEGAVALVNVPYEPLTKGPRGKVFAVVDYNETLDEHYRQINLDEPGILIRNGRTPSSSDWYFHQQMVYVVSSLVYATFRAALGRQIIWGFEPGEAGHAELLIRPHAFEGKNAFYVKERGELCFGYYRAGPKVAGRNLSGSFTFTCLSHDIIAHEVTHALVDGLRTHFTYPSHPDVLAFHEALADLVAIFQRFSYDTVVLAAIRKSRGKLARAELLTDIARQFNYTTSGEERPLRSAVDVRDEHQEPTCYRADAEPHATGSVLVSAVFEAFVCVFGRKTERYIRLATNGSGELPAGALSSDLQAVLAHKASKLASQFLTICIRAVDYCPPTDMRLGEYLRAIITADRDLVPDDPWGYREALIDAFRRRGIYPEDVPNLSEDALLWQPPERRVGRLKELSFARLRFRGDPARPAGGKELIRQACALGRVVARPDFAAVFGLQSQSQGARHGDRFDLPTVQSIRSSRRVGPDGQVVFDLVAEVIQRRTVRDERTGKDVAFYGGSTVIIDPRGEVRYVISKRVTNDRRLEGQLKYLSGSGRGFWEVSGTAFVPKRNLIRFLHGATAPH